MDVPASSHPEWKNIFNGKKNYEFEFLATKMTIARLNLGSLFFWLVMKKYWHSCHQADG